ncbi:ATP-binding protein [Kineosporia sp. NBRC 101731]|uniref:ATP-binding protein n=1 Tax=Kineosporia sp. NBRC 101731 TaxID=3032199 RepID=UPI0024A1717F|nr:ATP-binding protein [Kineosporia sp. NBRC 101731]GLY28591.1 histidine kinase [Kineosporia sp. NBRC 101731]
MSQTAATAVPCEDEPIRIPGTIQPHGALAVVDMASFHLLQASDNFYSVTGLDLRPGESRGLADLPETGTLTQEIRAWPFQPNHLFNGRLRLSDRELSVTAHPTPQGMILEFESLLDTDEPVRLDVRDPSFLSLSPLLEKFVEVGQVDDLGATLVREIKELTGFSRVLLYRFHRNGDPQVIAESNDGHLPSYIGLRFPASDIPAQARLLYLENRIRQMPDANYVPVGITPLLSPIDGQPLDLSTAALRSISPSHRQFVRNMGAVATMSISLINGGQLWGMVSCHHARVRAVSLEIRAMCDFICQITAQQFGSLEWAQREGPLARVQRATSTLTTALSRDQSLEKCFLTNAATWLDVAAADGAAIITEREITATGRTPDAQALGELVAGIWDTSAAVPQGSMIERGPAYRYLPDLDVIALPISDSKPHYLLWFRQASERSITWAGDRTVKETIGADGRIHPRVSFEPWTEPIGDPELAWGPSHVTAATHVRNAVISLLLRETLAAQTSLSKRLTAANTELESFSYSVAHDLRAPIRHISRRLATMLQSIEEEPDRPGNLLLQELRTTIRTADWGARLIDDLLMFARLGHEEVGYAPVDLSAVARTLTEFLQEQATDREVTWTIDDLPMAYGDPVLLRQVLFNLLDNALKYTAPCPRAEIRISGKKTPEGLIYTVSDNGVGFDMAYAGKLFGVFQRLHTSAEFPGTGIGLASVRRIIERHGGSVFARSRPDQGSEIGFVLPLRALPVTS